MFTIKVFEKLGIVKDFIYEVLIWCSGSDPTALEFAPNSEKIKHALYGTLVFIPATIGLFSMTYAISTLTHLVFINILAGITWAIIIFIVDRFIVSTFNKTTNVKTFITSFVTRLILAIFVGIIIGHPVVLLVLDSSLNSQLEKKRAIEYKKYDDQIIIIRNYYDSLNSSLLKKTDSLYAIKGKYVELLTAEQSGHKLNLQNIGSTSGQVGYKDRAKNYQIIVNDFQNRIDKTENNYKAYIKENDLLKTSIIDSIKTVAKRLDSVYSRDYLSRALVLEELKERDSQVIIIEYFIILFFIFLDTIPIVFKAITPSGVYEQIITSEKNIVDGQVPPGFYKYKKQRQLKNISTNNHFEIVSQKFKNIKTQILKKYATLNNGLNFDNSSMDLDENENINDDDSFKNNDFSKDSLFKAIDIDDDFFKFAGQQKTIDIKKSNKFEASSKTTNDKKGVVKIAIYLILILIQGILIYVLTKSIADVGLAALALFFLDFLLRYILKTKIV